MFSKLFLQCTIDNAGLHLRERLGDLVKADGIRSGKALRHVWLPEIGPLVVVVGVIRSVDALRTFDIVQILTAGGPGASTELLSLFVYKQLIKFGNFGYSAASALLMVVVASVLLLFASRWIGRTWSEERGP